MTKDFSLCRGVCQHRLAWGRVKASERARQERGVLSPGRIRGGRDRKRHQPAGCARSWHANWHPARGFSNATAGSQAGLVTPESRPATRGFGFGGSAQLPPELPKGLSESLWLHQGLRSKYQPSRNPGSDRLLPCLPCLAGNRGARGEVLRGWQANGRWLTLTARRYPPTSIRASFARSSGVRVVIAAASKANGSCPPARPPADSPAANAPLGPSSPLGACPASGASALTFSPSLVQAAVQAAGGVPASPLASSLATGCAPLSKLEVAGSNPVSRSRCSPLTAMVSGLFSSTPGTIHDCG